MTPVSGLARKRGPKRLSRLEHKRRRQPARKQGLRAGRSRAGMYGSLPFALAQCVVEVPYNLVQVRRAAGTLAGRLTVCGAVPCAWACVWVGVGYKRHPCHTDAVEV